VALFNACALLNCAFQKWTVNSLSFLLFGSLSSENTVSLIVTNGIAGGDTNRNLLKNFV
jgi:hypothetical protein